MTGTLILYTATAFLVGCLAGIAWAYIIFRPSRSACNQDCNQGRQCDCWKLRSKFESET